jgi:hypothetical protein
MFISLAKCVDESCGLKPTSDAEAKKYPCSILLPDPCADHDESENGEVMSDQDFISFLRSDRLATLFQGEKTEGNECDAAEQRNEVIGTMASSRIGTPLLHTPRTIRLSNELDFVPKYLGSAENRQKKAPMTHSSTRPKTPEQQKIADIYAEIEELRPTAFTFTKRGFMFSKKLPSIGTAFMEMQRRTYGWKFFTKHEASLRKGKRSGSQFLNLRVDIRYLLLFGRLGSGTTMCHRCLLLSVFCTA